MCMGRLAREYRALEREPVQYVRTAADPANLLELHFVVHGVPDTPYEAGYYHGVLRFPPAYPLVPPAIVVHTPSGRFEPGARLCLSMSDYHPESWNPLWSVATILVGLVSFMCEESHAVGSLTGVSAAARRRLAAASLEWNVRHSPAFAALFPDLARLAAARRTARAAATRANTVVDPTGRALARTRRASTAIAVSDVLAGRCPSLAADPALRCAAAAALVFLVAALVLVYCFRSEIRALSAHTVSLTHQQ